MDTEHRKTWLDYIEKILFAFFVLSIPLSIRKVFYFISPSGDAVFNEYTDISLYLSDVLFLCFFLFIILRNKKLYLSSYYWKQMFHVEHFLSLILTPLVFVLWSFLTIFWAESKIIGTNYAFKTLEMYFVYVAAILYFVPRGTFEEAGLFHVEHLKKQICSTWNKYHYFLIIFIFSAVLNAIVGILQFFYQSSIGLYFLKESMLSPEISGVAKVVMGDSVLIRAYGLFPHPNVFGAFLSISLIFLVISPSHIRKMFHVEHFKWIYRTVLGVIILGILTSFSKNAIVSVGAAIGTMYILFHVEHLKKNRPFVPRGTNSDAKEYVLPSHSLKTSFRKMFHVEHSLLLFLIFLLILLILPLNKSFFLLQPILERIELYKAFFLNINHFIIFGLGSGQWVISMQHFFPYVLDSWKFQPIHNTYLMILAELGFIGFVLFFYFYSRLIKLFYENVPRGTFFLTITGCFIFITVSFMFDHFFYDLQQGQMLLWFILGIAASKLLKY